MKRSDGKKTPEERRPRPRVHVMTEIGVSGTLGQQAAALVERQHVGHAARGRQLGARREGRPEGRHRDHVVVPAARQRDRAQRGAGVLGDPLQVGDQHQHLGPLAGGRAPDRLGQPGGALASSAWWWVP